MVNLSLENKTVKIDKGELVGYTVAGHQYIHQKGSPGWRSADTEMFPIIGPTADAGFKVQTIKGAAIQDQHGLLREMEYKLTESNTTKAVFVKKYTANTEIKNSKYPAKSTAEILAWPYSFEFVKTFQLSKEGITVSFSISGEKGMPFMLGYHPAFNLVTETPVVVANDKEISLKEVLAVGSRALHVKNCNKIVLKDKNELQITTEGFGDFMLWTEVNTMICIEPITFYPYAVAQENLHNGFTILGTTPEVFKVHISVL
ncbi:aldose 1-epimerase [Cellulophaga sp. HaHaR_3_176]|uniref:aldose epimerase family protein n=1 Tax=Cellulophaga sp. HaHaR_3_176 TaxID=1942464 RepID=UPI001C1F6810|nr:aldose 1-epimerase [Cellulophaga sp. HaHaR_3_176]QWX84347.1 aldose 1-epimerase [Cellulophaga sp. HaHaR_3_176]